MLDLFSRQVNIAFDLGIPYQSIGFGAIQNRFEDSESDFADLINEFRVNDDYRYFRDMRNRMTHRLPFVFTGNTDQIFFPDDPKNDDFYPVVDKKIDVMNTCFKWGQQIMLFIDKGMYLCVLEIADLIISNKETGRSIPTMIRFMIFR